MNGPLAAFVITFRRSEVVTDTVGRLLAQSRPPERVLVVDNGASTDTRERLAALGDRRVEYHAMDRNAGPAGAAALAVEKLIGDGHEWILWGDDDDPPRTEDTLARLAALIGEHPADDLGGVGATGVRWDWQHGVTRRLADGDLDGVRSIDAIGGNQCLIVRSRAVADAGLPNADLFFGLEEMEFCLRIRRAGYRLLVDGELLREYRRLSGRLGIEVQSRARRHYPLSALWRRYYNTRNYIHLMRRVFGRPDLARREAGKAVVRSLLAWSRGPRYGSAYTRLQWLGVRDGYAGRLGLTVPPHGDGRGEAG